MSNKRKKHHSKAWHAKQSERKERKVRHKQFGRPVLLERLTPQVATNVLQVKGLWAKLAWMVIL